MKSYKIFIESTRYSHDEFVNILHDIIEKDNKTINGFEFSIDNMTGTFEWDNNEYVVYATPYWDGSKKLPFNIILNKDGDEIDQMIFKLKELKIIEDIKPAVEYYYRKVDEITSQLVKKSELKKDLELILKSISPLNINGYTYYRDDKKRLDEVYKLTLEDVINMKNIITKKYSYIFSANKYNL